MNIFTLKDKSTVIRQLITHPQNASRLIVKLQIGSKSNGKT